MRNIKNILKKARNGIFTLIFPDLKSILNKTNFCDNENKIMIYYPYTINDVSIGSYTYIAKNSEISITTIGKYCSIGPNFFCGFGIHPTNGISTSPMFYSTKKQNGISLTSNEKILERKRIVIGNDVFIGANVTVLDGITINDGAIIGAGAVVSKDIPPYAIAVGCPIKIIKYRFNQEIIQKLINTKWWNFNQNKINMIEKYFFDINTFINHLE